MGFYSQTALHRKYYYFENEVIIFTQTRDEKFEPIRLTIYELLSLRSQVIKNPPLNQLDEIKQLIAAKIDQGNS